MAKDEAVLCLDRNGPLEFTKDLGSYSKLKKTWPPEARWWGLIPRVEMGWFGYKPPECQAVVRMSLKHLG